MMQKKIQLLDSNKRLSESLLWQFQRDYFEQQGVEAWKQAVPFYVTSNPYIAYSYAKISISFIMDYVTKHPESKNNPFYVIELGTGSGCFSYYALKYMKELIDTFGLQDLNIKYIMTDFTENNLEFWRQQEKLVEFVDLGMLDFAIFNMETDSQVNLTESGHVLSKGSVKNPITVFANYIFDTVSHDCFKIKDGKMEEALVSLHAPSSDYENNKLKKFDNLKVEFSTRDADDNYYSDQNYNKILKHFKNRLNNTYMLFPLAGINTIKNLMQLNAKMLLVSSDKAYSSLEQIDYLGEPGISFHGSFSLMVNYNAIAEYFKCLGGEAMLQVPRQGLDTFLGLSGMSLKDFPSLYDAANNYVNEMSPSHYFLMYRKAISSIDSHDTSSLASTMCFSKWDPHVFKRMIQKLCKEADSADKVSMNYLANNMDKIADNFYFMPGCHDILFDVGLFFYYSKRYNKALHYFKKSEKYFGDKFNLRYNISLTLYYLKEYDKSLESFETALKYDPKSKSVKDWIKHIKKNH